MCSGTRAAPAGSSSARAAESAGAALSRTNEMAVPSVRVAPSPADLAAASLTSEASRSPPRTVCSAPARCVSQARRACADPELDVAERPGRVRVGRDGDPCPGLAGQPGVRIAHVEPVGLRVDLERGPVSTARATIRSTSTSAPGRRLRRRPVRWPMQSTCGLSRAARMRSVGLRSCAWWSEATTQSSLASASSATSRRAVGADVDLDAVQEPERARAERSARRSPRPVARGARRAGSASGR